MNRERASAEVLDRKEATALGLGHVDLESDPAPPLQGRHASFAAEIGAHTSDPNFMMSLARGLQVTEALSARKRPSTVSQISIDTGLSRAVVRRCLHTLTQLGCTGCDDRRHFFLVSEVMWGVDIPTPR